MRLAVAVVDHEEAAAVEAIALQSIDDPRQRVELAQDDRDLIDEKALAIVEKGRHDTWEVFRADLASLVFVLGHIGLSDVVPYLNNATVVSIGSHPYNSMKQ